MDMLQDIFLSHHYLTLLLDNWTRPRRSNSTKTVKKTIFLSKQ